MYINNQRFEWDPDKALLNEARHGVRFDWAALVFSDPDGFIASDEKHSLKEIRQLAFGSVDGVVIVAAFTIRPGHSIRIISARKADRKERSEYEKRKTR
jgi:uncharacterized DUF497 family protein